MISLYTGTVGSGKSYHALELGINFVKKNGFVIANFPIKLPKNFLSKRHKRRWEGINERWIFNEDISVQYLMSMAFEKGWFGKEKQCLVIIDEAGIMFNSRDWAHERDVRMSWIKFLSQSRKFGYDFVFVAQQDRMIDRQIRGLVEYEVKHRKINNSKFFAWLSLFRLSCFMYIYKWYGTRLKANMQLSFYKQWVANRYDTMRIFNLEELIISMESVYAGKIIPAPVASQLAIFKEQLEQKKAKKNVAEKSV